MKTLRERMRRDLSAIGIDWDTYKAEAAHTSERIERAKAEGRTGLLDKGGVWHLRHAYVRDFIRTMSRVLSYLSYFFVFFFVLGWVL